MNTYDPPAGQQTSIIITEDTAYGQRLVDRGWTLRPEPPGYDPATKIAEWNGKWVVRDLTSQELADMASSALFLKQRRITEILNAAMANEIDPDFTAAGVNNFPLALRSWVNGLIVQVQAALAAKGKAVQLVVPATGGTQSFGTAKKDEILALNHTSGIATQTFVFPSDASSAPWQELRVFSRSIITAVTLSAAGQTILGATLATLPASGNACWWKVGPATWARVQ